MLNFFFRLQKYKIFLIYTNKKINLQDKKKSCTFAPRNDKNIRNRHLILYNMSQNLVIVESPTKAKTIEKFLGKNYTVLSSQGHIRDIEGIGKNSMGIDFENQYRPNYVIDAQKHQLLNTLRQEVKKADTVWLASDEDREGEAIAWHLQEVLELPKEQSHRIVFHEITPTAIQEALLHPRQIDYNLVNAQQARRVIDRIVGFELSPVLWRKVATGLSAGRVQSVAVRLIVEREREIEDFKEQQQYRITAEFIGKNKDGQDVVIQTELNHRFATQQQAKEFLDVCSQTQFSISQIQTKPAKRQPAPPFTTSSLQQEAARKLKFPVSRTMRLAQSLYEAGHITYMRTDSVNLSSLAIGACKKEIIDEYGEKYSRTRQYKTVSKGAQEAHEAIRPTYMNQRQAGRTADEKRLYELIWKRTLASQMADAETETTRVEITSPDTDYAFVAVGEVILFDGFMRVYIQSTDDENAEATTVLPHLDKGMALACNEYIATEQYTKPPIRYTEAALVKRMEELGIGRPSTYATIIETIQSRKYAIKGSVPGEKRIISILTMRNGRLALKQRPELFGHDAQKLIPTDLGRLTNDFLVQQFPDILSFDFTANEEENFDKVAAGKADWVKTVDTFYQKFHPAIQHIPAGKMASRTLGTDPVSGAPVLAKISKIGPCVQLGVADNGKPRFASLQPGQSIYTITLEQALELFKEAKNKVLFLLGGKEVIYGTGKFGPYIKCGDQYLSVPRTTSIGDLTPATVQAMLNAKADQALPIRQIGDFQIMRGQYGLYLKTAQGNYKLSKNCNIDELSIEACQKIIDNYKDHTKYARKHS